MPAKGCYWSEDFEKSFAYWAFRLITGTMTGKVDFDRAKDKIFRTINASAKVDQCVLLALDQVYDEQGHTNLTKWTNLYVDNATIVDLAAANPRILFGASVHPYRSDWLDALDYCLAHKAVLCKWLPSAQCIDPTHQKCMPFYDSLASHKLPLLCHVGPEYSIPTHDKYFARFNNAKYLRPALEKGVIVIFAHGSLPFEPTPLEHDDAYRELLNIISEAEAKNWNVYVDISALCLFRSSYVPDLIKDIPAKRLLFGSDYPIPMTNLGYKRIPTAWDWVKHFWQTLFTKNLLDKNYLLLEDMGFPPEVFTQAEALFSHIVT
jgi:predicted TIM-barrel fold metal-dependent hydrolase